MSGAEKDKAMYELNFTDAEWDAWAEGADPDDILAARPSQQQQGFTARVAQFFKSEPEADWEAGQ